MEIIPSGEDVEGEVVRPGPFLANTSTLSKGLCSFAQDLKVARVSEDPGSAPSGDFSGDTEVNQVIQGDCHRGNGQLERVRQRTDCDQWFPLHIFMNAQCGRSCTSETLDSVSVFREEVQNLFCSISPSTGHRLRAFQEKRQPLFPSTFRPDPLKQIVIPGAVCLEV